jgi:hypothetical protein
MSIVSEPQDKIRLWRIIVILTARPVGYITFALMVANGCQKKGNNCIPPTHSEAILCFSLLWGMPTGKEEYYPTHPLCSDSILVLLWRMATIGNSTILPTHSEAIVCFYLLWRMATDREECYPTHPTLRLLQQFCAFLYCGEWQQVGKNTIPPTHRTL